MRFSFIAAAAVATVMLASGEARAQIFPPQLVQKALNKSVPLMQASGGRFEARMGKKSASPATTSRCPPWRMPTWLAAASS